MSAGKKKTPKRNESLDTLLKRVEKGERVPIRRGGRVSAYLVPVEDVEADVGLGDLPPVVPTRSAPLTAEGVADAIKDGRE